MTRFRAARHHYERNQRDSIALNARPAIVEAPHDKEEAGIVLSIGNRPICVLTPDAALRVAQQIADHLTELRR